MPVLWHQEKLMSLPKPVLAQVASQVFGMAPRKHLAGMPKTEIARALLDFQRRFPTPLVWSRPHLQSLPLRILTLLGSQYFGLGPYPKLKKLGRKRLISIIESVQRGQAPNPPGFLDLAILALYAARTLMNPPRFGSELHGYRIGPWETDAVVEWASNDSDVYDYLVQAVTGGKHPGEIKKKTVPALAQALESLVKSRAGMHGIDDYWMDLRETAISRVDWRAAAREWAGFPGKPKVKKLEPHLGFGNQPTWLVYTMFVGRPELEQVLQTSIQTILFNLSWETQDVQSVPGYVGRRLEGWLQSALLEMIHDMKPVLSDPLPALLAAVVRHVDYYNLANIWMEAFAGISP